MSRIWSDHLTDLAGRNSLARSQVHQRPMMITLTNHRSISMVIVLTTDHSNPYESQFGFELHLTVEGNDQNCETTGRFKLYLLYCFNRNNFSKVMRSLPDHDLQSFNVIRSAPKLPSTCQCHQQHLNSMRLLC